MPSSRRLLHLLTLLLAVLMSVGTVTVPTAIAAPTAVTDDPDAKYHAPNGPPNKPDPTWFSQWNDRSPDALGIDPDKHWCMLPEANNCTLYKKPEIHDECEEYNRKCDDPKLTEERKQRELANLADWENATDHNAYGYKEADAAIRKCIEGGQNFHDCQQLSAQLMVPPTNGPLQWLAGKVSKLASDALKEAAATIGDGVVWLLKQFAEEFNKASTIDLSKAGIGQIAGIMTVLSVIVALFLLFLQMGKAGISQQGGPIGVAVAGLGKWVLGLCVYGLATQAALMWVDQVSIWIVNYTFAGGGSGADDATKAMKTQLGTLFSALVAGGGSGATGGAALVAEGGVLSQAVGVVIVVGILCIIAVGALWLETLVRQAGIMILVATMPISLAGQLSDGTREWWTKARNALISLILMKLAIVTCFAIGFSALARGDGIMNVLAGLLMFILACFAWPVLARFLTFTSAGGGNGAAGGLLGLLGSSAGAAIGGYAGSVSGAGAVGAGPGFARAVESDTAATTSSSAGGGRGGFWKSAGKVVGGAGTAVGLGLQAASAGLGALEGATANAAAHAGLGPAQHSGGAVVGPRRAGNSSQPNKPSAADKNSGTDGGSGSGGPNSSGGPDGGATAPRETTPPAQPATTERESTPTQSMPAPTRLMPTPTHDTPTQPMPAPTQPMPQTGPVRPRPAPPTNSGS
ncbi:hypothetical protein ACIGZJ_36050 [Kitasatospora sp. NPDC052868]|uniref:hypothetical protein n=1 Tax=Kitasatospora sp. NPDC052868 TaxID=3364060 RepID=UPI0037CBED57